jgi:glutamyl-Q tRNA(Asp) synthetase
MTEQRAAPIARQPSAYRGRFAPSPTGPLHFGSLVAAVGSYLQARVNHGVWLVRMEDLDPPREIPGAADAILRSLERFGLQWDEPVIYQSQRHAHYSVALQALQQQAAIYPCGCTRREIADSDVTGIDGPLYPGTCRNGLPAGRNPRAWRVRTDSGLIRFDDTVQGVIESRLARDTGDFVLKRADGFYAYQLAVVVDDAAQGITEVVRGCDLLGSTARQIHLQRLLSLPMPAYLHLPVAVNGRGEKLSKQTFAAPLDLERPVPALHAALQFLGQQPPQELHADTLETLWGWAMAHWQPRAIPRTRTIAIDD